MVVVDILRLRSRGIGAVAEGVCAAELRAELCSDGFGSTQHTQWRRLYAQNNVAQEDDELQALFEVERTLAACVETLVDVIDETFNGPSKI